MFVKKFTKLLFPFAFAAVVFSAGCGGSEKQKNYTLFTNMPDGQYSVIAEQYTQGGKISGYTGDIDNQPFTPPENYSHKRMYYNYMFADAELIVADDFTAEGAEAKFRKSQRRFKRRSVRAVVGVQKFGYLEIQRIRSRCGV